METVYIETTIPSYLTALRSQKEPMASHQRMTREWWERERVRFRLYSSIAVRAEISKGDATAAARRLKAMADIPELELTPEIQPLADSIVHLLELPPKAALDAVHVAFAIVHRMDYLLTWNCTHLANATLQKTLFEYCTYHRLHMPVICTPELLAKPEP
jgi:predicted nucleic acid-binding protein